MDEKTARELHEEVTQLRIKIMNGISKKDLDNELHELQQTFFKKIK